MFDALFGLLGLLFELLCSWRFSCVLVITGVLMALLLTHFPDLPLRMLLFAATGIVGVVIGFAWECRAKRG